jgi:hypothetical protein
MFSSEKRISNAIATYSTAKGYVQSAYLIISNPLRLQVNIDPSIILSYHLLLGFAVELYLKALLQHDGHSETDLKRHGVRHNLSKLLEMCDAKDMPSAVASGLVAYLDHQHANFEYRYVTVDGSYNVRRWQAEVFAELNILDEYVDRKIGASASKQLSPGSSGWTISEDFNGWRIPNPD